MYGVSWCPHNPNMLGSVSGDRTLRVWDRNLRQCVHSIPAHGHDVLTLDWCKYQQNTIATGSADKLIKLWDLRKTSMAIVVLAGHDLAVRRVKCSPHERHVVASVSYDMSVRLWDSRRALSSMLKRYDHHTEFVCGVDFNLFVPGEIATSSWDRSVHIWNLRGRPPLPQPPSKRS